MPSDRVHNPPQDPLDPLALDPNDDAGRSSTPAPRIREPVGLTPDGRLRTCLFDDGEVDLRARLRGGAGDAELAEIIRAAVLRKPPRHTFHDGPGRKCTSAMSRIGG